MTRQYPVNIANTAYIVDPSESSGTVSVHSRHEGAAVTTDLCVAISKDGIKIFEDRSNGEIMTSVSATGGRIKVESNGTIVSEDDRPQRIEVAREFKNAAEFTNGEPRIANAIEHALQAIGMLGERAPLSAPQKEAVKLANAQFNAAGVQRL